MKILHSSDIHFNQKLQNDILRAQHKADIIALSGDFLDESLEVPLNLQISQTKKWLESLSLPVFVCSGNHDIDSPWMDEIKKVYKDNDIINIDGFKVGMVAYLYEDLEPFDDCDILLAHVPPKYSKTARTKNKDYGDEMLYRAIKYNFLKAKVILCGHIHKPIKRYEKLKNTKIYNNAKTYKIIDF